MATRYQDLWKVLTWDFTLLASWQFSVSTFHGCWLKTRGFWVKDKGLHYSQHSRQEVHAHTFPLPLRSKEVTWNSPGGCGTQWVFITLEEPWAGEITFFYSSLQANLLQRKTQNPPSALEGHIMSSKDVHNTNILEKIVWEKTTLYHSSLDAQKFETMENCFPTPYWTAQPWSPPYEPLHSVILGWIRASKRLSYFSIFLILYHCNQNWVLSIWYYFIKRITLRRLVHLSKNQKLKDLGEKN